MAGDLKFPATGLDSFALSDQANIWDVIKNGGGLNTNKSIIFELLGTSLTPDIIAFPLVAAFANIPDGLQFNMRVLDIQFRHTSLSPPPLQPTNFFYVFSRAPSFPFSLFATIQPIADFQLTQVVAAKGMNVQNETISPFSIGYFANVPYQFPTFNFTTPLGAFEDFNVFVESGRGTFVFPQTPILTIELIPVAQL